MQQLLVVCLLVLAFSVDNGQSEDQPLKAVQENDGHPPGNHIPFSLVPKAYLTIPSNVNYAVPLGQ